MAWLTGWSHRKEITVSNGSADYQTKVLVGESSGATGEEVDCGGHIAADFDDLRFTGADGTTLLDYWIESITGSTPNGLATVWVQNNATPDTTLYIYYGGTETAVSSGANTFIQYHGAASASFHDADVTPTTGGLRFRARARATGNANDNILYGLGSDGYTLSDDWIGFQFFNSAAPPVNSRLCYAANNGTSTVVSETPTLNDNTYYTVYGLLLFGTSFKGYVEDAGGQIGTTITTNLPNEAMGLFMYEANLNGDQLWSWVGKYAATEPSFAFGKQETQVISASSLKASSSIGRDVDWMRDITSTLDLSTTVRRIWDGAKASVSTGLTAATSMGKSFGKKITTAVSLTLGTTIGRLTKWARGIVSGLKAALKILYRPKAITQPPTLITASTARLNGKIAWDGGETCEARFRWRVKDYCLDFDGVDDYVDVGTLGNYGSQIDTGTIEFWLRMQTFPILGYSDPMGVWGTENSSAVQVVVDGIQDWIELYIRDNDTPDSKLDAVFQCSELNTNQWYHIGLTFNLSQGDVHGYLNGINLECVDFFEEGTWSSRGNFKNFYLGAFNLGDSPSDVIDGNLSDVRIWNVVRTQQQIQDNMWLRLTGSEEGLWAYWKLDEGTGVETIDATGNGNDGDIEGAIWLLDWPGWVPTDWQNTLETNDTYYSDISGLDAGTEYEFQAQAKNTSGEGQWSTSRNFWTAFGIGVLLDASVAITRTVDWARASSSSLTLATTIIKAWGRSIVTSCGLTLSTTIGRLVEWTRDTTSNLTAGTSISRLAKWIRSSASGLTVAVSVIASIITNFIITLGTSLSVSTAVTRTVDWARIVSATLDAATSITRSRGRTIASSVGLTISATIGRLAEWVRSLAPSLAGASSVSRKFETTRASVFNLTVATSITKTRGFPRVVSVGLTVATSISRLVEWIRTTASGLTTSVSITAIAELISHYLITTATSLSVAVSLTRKWTIQRAISTGLTVSLSLSRLVEFIRAIPANLTSGVALNRAVAYMRDATAGLTASVSIDRLARFIRATASKVLIAASVIVGGVVNYVITFVTNLTVGVSVSRLFKINRDISVNLNVQAIIDRLFKVIRIIGARITLSVTLSKIYGWVKTTSANLSASVTITRTVEWFREISSNLGLIATLDRIADFGRATTSSLTAAVSISRLTGFIRTISANVAVSVSVKRTVAWLREIPTNIDLGVSILVNGITNTIITIGANLTVAVSIVRNVDWTRIIPSSLGLISAIARSSGFYRTASANLSLLVSIIAKQWWCKPLRMVVDRMQEKRMEQARMARCRRVEK